MVDLSTLMIRTKGSGNDDLLYDTSSLPGGKKLIDTNVTLSGPRQWPNIAGVELPADHVLAYLVDSFFSSVNWFMMVFHEDVFRSRYLEILRQEHVRYQDSTFYWTCMLVVALGAHYASLGAPQDPMSGEYQQLSRDLLSVIEARFLHIVGCPNLETVQICVLLGSFVFYTRPTTGLGICGMGVKIAQAIGLHRESFWKEASPLLREEKRRTWWTLEVFDKYAAVAFGRPCIIDDSDCEVEMITDIDMDGSTHFPARPLVLYHQHKFRLYRIMGAFLGRKRHRNTFESIDTIHRRMLRWRQELPEVLTLGGHEPATDRQSVTPMHVHALSLQLTYDNLQIILHRSAVFSSDAAAGSSSGMSVVAPDGSTSLRQMLDSALDTSGLHRHSAALDTCRRSHADVHVGITMFTAGVVLCAICLSQPLAEMGSRAKTGVMHIIRMCRETTSGTYGDQLISKQSLSIIDSLVEVMLRQETDVITGRVGLPTEDAPHMKLSAETPGQGPSSSSAVGSARGPTAVDAGTGSGSGGPRTDLLLEPIQEVFGQHIHRIASQPNTPVNTENHGAALSTPEAAGYQETSGSSFTWDGDATFLVDSGLVDASQLWLWADNLGYESFQQPE